MKKVLIIGGGGREHAICWKLSQSPKISNIFALPGSDGIGLIPKCMCLKDINTKDFKAISLWSQENEIDLVVVGPEDPLANGLCDILQENNILCFGPTSKGAKIESDKSWAKEFMYRHGIPTARFQAFTDSKAAKEFIKNASFKALVVKASGLAAGKGVVVAADINEACQAVDEILGQKKYGSAGQTIVIEELLFGEEISVLAFVDGSTVKVMLPAQDHKRLRERDQGPNTGGMGAYCPCPLINASELEFVKKEVLQKAVDGLGAEGISYCGVLYAGLMMTSEGPRVLEFNCRFGDPETQVILPLLETDLYEVISSCCENRLSTVDLKWNYDMAAVGVVIASSGYPESSTKGNIITGIPKMDEQNLIFHSAIKVNAAGEFITDGGRVLTAVAIRKNLRHAAEEATHLCEKMHFSGSGKQFRKDIAQKAFQTYVTSS